jgi:hypothetical protein
MASSVVLGFFLPPHTRCPSLSLPLGNETQEQTQEQTQAWVSRVSV